MKLEEDRFQSAYIATIIRNKRTSWVDSHLKKKIFKEGDSILVYSSKTRKHPGKLKMCYVRSFKIHKDLGQGTL